MWIRFGLQYATRIKFPLYPSPVNAFQFYYKNAVFMKRVSKEKKKGDES